MATQAQRRADLPPNFWKGGVRRFRGSRESFRVVGIQASGNRVSLDDITTSLAWEDASVARTGTVSLNRPGTRHGGLGIGMGEQVQVYVSPWGQGRWKPLWRMRVQTAAKDIVSGGVDYEVADDIVFLARSRMDWKFTKQKSGPHKKGWTCDEIARAVLRRAGVRHGKLHKGTHRIKNLTSKNASPLDIIIRAYRHERQKSGIRFVIAMENRRLTVRPLRYSSYMYEIGPHVVGASLTETMRHNMATVLNVRATAGKKKKKTKIHVRVQSPRLRRRYGRIERDITVQADTVAEARREARRILAKRALPKREVTFTHPGITNIRRGHAMRLYFPHENLRQVVFVKEVRHNVSSGVYEMEVTVGFDDPYKDYREERNKRRRCAAARRAGRTPPDDCPTEHKKPQRADRREDS